MRLKVQIQKTMLLFAGMLIFTGCGKNTLSDSAVYGVVDLTPYVTLGEYEGVHIQKVTPQEVTDAEVKSQMEQLMASAAGKREEKDGPIEKGDYVVVSFQGYLEDMQVEEAGFEDMTLQVGQYLMLPDFEDGLIGAQNGDMLTIEVKIPEDYDDTYAGQVMEYDVKISDVYCMHIPELTDANVRQYLEVDSVKELEKEIRQSLQEEYEKAAQEEMDAAAMQAVIASAVIKEYPEKYVEQFAEKVQQGYEEDAAARGLSMSEYVEQMQLDEEGFLQQVYDIAKANLASEMVYQAIIQKEKLTLTEEELKKGAEDFVDGSTYVSVEDVLEKVDEKRLEQRILYKKAYEWVAAHAVVES